MKYFVDFNFKLVVLQELLDQGYWMDSLASLTSKPSIERRRAGKEAYGQPIKEMEDFFDSIVLTPHELSKVERLYFDGGQNIYQLIFPFWDGECGYFDITNVDGFEHLHNLKVVAGDAMIPYEQVCRFTKAGIAYIC